MAGPRDPAAHASHRALPTGGVLNDRPDPDALLAALRDAAGEPPLPPLTLGQPTASARVGVVGRVVTRARGAVLRLLTPAIADLIAQLERDRRRQQAELGDLRRRVAELEAERR